MSGSQTVRVVIASPLEPELVERIRGVDPRLEVIYEPELLPPPRYPADHTGPPDFRRSPEQERRWRELLSEAEILFDFDRSLLPEFRQVAPRVRWVQATSSGIGHLVARHGLQHTDIILTTARGVHAVPLAEFVLMGMLMLAKGVFRMLRDQAARHWERYAVTELRGRRAGVLCLGEVGREVARLARAVGVEVHAVRRRLDGTSPAALGVDALYPIDRLHDLLAAVDYVVCCCPHTPETEGMLDARAFAAMKPGAGFINVGRGAVVDEAALVAALRSGHLQGAILDVFAVEPLPPDSPLWTMDNVLISPHSASTVPAENERIVDIFCDNLRRYLTGRPLRNLFDKRLLY